MLNKINIQESIFFILFIAVIFMSIGYSALNTNLTISGGALVTSLNSKILITDTILENSYQAFEQYSTTYEDTKVNFFLKINYASSTMVYKVTITNNTSTTKVYTGFKEEYSNKNLSFRIDNFSIGDVLAPGESVIATVTLGNFVNYTVTGNISIEFLFEEMNNIPEVEKVLTGATTTTNSYVRTGFYPSINSKVIVDYTLTSDKSVSTWLFSSRRAYQNQMFAIAWNSTESLLQFHRTSYNLGSTGMVPNVRYSAEISKDTLTLNGRHYYNPGDTSWNSIFELYLFANNEARLIKGHVNGTAIIHSIKLYENDILIIDAVPVELTNGEIAFYNKINNMPLETVGNLVGIYE